MIAPTDIASPTPAALIDGSAEIEKHPTHEHHNPSGNRREDILDQRGQPFVIAGEGEGAGMVHRHAILQPQDAEQRSNLAVPDRPSGEQLPALRDEAHQAVAFSDQAAAERLRFLFREAQSGMRRVVALGLYAIWMGDVALKHGEFGPWVEQHCPEISYRSVRAYSQLTRQVFGVCNFEIGRVLPICRQGEIFLLADSDIPLDAREIFERVCREIDGKSQNQLLLKFRNPAPSQGGDKEWESWLREHHPELCGGETLPKRKASAVPPEVWAAWEKFQAEQEKKNLTPEVRRKMALKAADDLEDSIYTLGVRHPHLKLLPAADLAPLRLATKQLLDRLDAIIAADEGKKSVRPVKPQA